MVAEGKGQGWVILGLVTALLGFFLLMRHSGPRWLAIVCFAATATFFYLNYSARKKAARSG
jgi:hypothetical protein